MLTLWFRSVKSYEAEAWRYSTHQAYIDHYNYERDAVLVSIVLVRLSVVLMWLRIRMPTAIVRATVTSATESVLVGGIIRVVRARPGLVIALVPGRRIIARLVLTVLVCAVILRALVIRVVMLLMLLVLIVVVCVSRVMVRAVA